jgi:hypothetical protein
MKGLAVIAALVVSAIATTGCGGSESLTETSIHSALEKLPYRYSYRNVTSSGDGVVVAGIARLGGHATYFAVIAGQPKVEGRVVPRQALPNGGLQRGVDDAHGSGYVTKFVYTPTSIPQISGDIDAAICDASGEQSCRGV